MIDLRLVEQMEVLQMPSGVGIRVETAPNWAVYMGQ